MSIPAQNNTYALLSGHSWSSSVLGYFFADSTNDYRYSFSYMDGFQSVGAEVQQAVRNILQGPTSVPSSGDYMTLTSASAVANLTFYSTGNSPSDIAIGQSSLLDRPMAYYPDATWSDVRAGDVWLSGDIIGAQVGSFGYHSTLHELGHALGLKHGHEQGDTYNPFVLSADRDSIEFSIMTYHTYIGDTVEGFGNAVGPQTFMMYDIAALLYLYGANFNTNNTDTVYKWTPERQTFVNGVEVGYNYHIFETIWDGGGIDTYDFSSFDQDMTIDLNPGAWSVVSTNQLAPLGDGHLARGNVFNALQYNGDPRSLIENAIGAIGNDKITGNVADNRLEGSYGDDTLLGGDGNDSLNGGEGNDSLLGGNGNDAIYGGAGDDIVYGGAGADALNGGAGRNTLSHFDAQGGVTVKLWANSVSGDIAQGDTISHFQDVSGGAGGDWLEGDANDNILDGCAGGDLLIGLGGNDLLFGREGNDTLIADWGTDILEGGSGNDLFAIWATTQHAIINDFKHGEDHIQLSTSLFKDFAAIKAGAVQQGDDVLITRSGLDILLKHVQLASLTASDFQFV